MYLFVYDISSLPVISFQRGFDSWMHDLNTAHLACSHSWCMCTMNFKYIYLYIYIYYVYIYIWIYMYIDAFLFFYTKTYMYVYVYLSMTIYNILYINNIIIQNVYLYISAFSLFFWLSLIVEESVREVSTRNSSLLRTDGGMSGSNIFFMSRSMFFFTPGTCSRSFDCEALIAFSTKI